MLSVRHLLSPRQPPCYRPTLLAQLRGRTQVEREQLPQLRDVAHHLPSLRAGAGGGSPEHALSALQHRGEQRAPAPACAPGDPRPRPTEGQRACC